MIGIFKQRQRWLLVSIIAGSQSVLAANVELDSSSTPAGYVSLLLINETLFPGERGFRSEQDSKAAMLAILWVLHCRVSAIPNGYTQKEVADVDSRSVIDVITADGVKDQVRGFYWNSAGRFVAARRVHQRVNYLVSIANQGPPGRTARLLGYARDLGVLYFQGGPAGGDVFAKLRRIGAVPVTGRAYAWMHDQRGADPRGAFVRIPDADQGSLGGNRFYTLQKRQ